MKGRIKAWVQASRAPFFVATLIPLGLAGAIAAKHGAWNFPRWALVLMASFFVHLATNLANDYFEYESGADEGDSIGGSRVLQEGKITMEQLRNALVLLYTAAAVCGLWILWASGVVWLLPLMLIALFSSIFYTAPPIRYGYHGLGELFVGANMGVIMTVGGTAALTGRFNPESFWLSVPVALMVALILFYQSLSDIEVDRSVGKFTTAVGLGKDRAIWGFRFLALGAVVSIAALPFYGLTSYVALAALGSLYPACQVDTMIRTTPDWTDLHDRGGRVRMFYFLNGLILIASVLLR